MDSLIAFFEQANKQPAIWGFIGTIVGACLTLLGTFITQYAAYMMKDKEFKHQENQRRTDEHNELKRKYIIEPALEWLKMDLKDMQHTYSLISRSKPERIKAKSDDIKLIEVHVADLCVIEAMLAALQLDEVNNLFKTMSNNRVNLNSIVFADAKGDEYLQLKNQISNTAKLVSLLIAEATIR